MKYKSILCIVLCVYCGVCAHQLENVVAKTQKTIKFDDLALKKCANEDWSLHG